MKPKMLIAATLIICGVYTAGAQTFPGRTPATTTIAGRGLYGGYLGIGYVTGQNQTIVLGTVTAVSATHPDTLVSPAVNATGYGTDSGYVFFSNQTRAVKTYDLAVNRISGTLAGTAILQGSLDGKTWYTLTGVTTYCASCKGASATISGTGTTHYTWVLPPDADNFQYHQIFPVLSGTCSATFSGTLTTSY